MDWKVAVLASVARLQGKAYSVAVMDDVSMIEGREVAYGSIHVTLDRLRKDGCLTSEMGSPTPVRGGRRKRYYALTDKGKQVLADEIARQERLFEGLDLRGPIKRFISFALMAFRDCAIFNPGWKTA